MAVALQAARPPKIKCTWCDEYFNKRIRTYVEKNMGTSDLGDLSSESRGKLENIDTNVGATGATARAYYYCCTLNSKKDIKFTRTSSRSTWKTGSKNGTSRTGVIKWEAIWVPKKWNSGE